MTSPPVESQVATLQQVESGRVWFYTPHPAYKYPDPVTGLTPLDERITYSIPLDYWQAAGKPMKVLVTARILDDEEPA